MPKPRCEIVSLDGFTLLPLYFPLCQTSFLCGTENGISYERRRDWIEERILQLSQIFAIDVCAYAVMSNHYQVVLHVNQEKAATWDLKTLFQQWSQLFSLPPLVERYVKNETMDAALLAVVEKYAKKYRQQLTDISWFMRTLNEPIARRANKEDSCTGHFWESRFSSTLLADEAAVLACMVYVDLNPVRANMAPTPESSDYTSIKARIDCPEKTEQLMSFLLKKTDQKPDTSKTSIPFSWPDYLQLIDWTGRAIRDDKRGSISQDIPPILQRLNLDVNEWLKQHHQLESYYPVFMGHWKQLEVVCQALKRKWCKGSARSRLLFGT
ncbi:MAG: transposase [Gammaproteobacteria bacterium]